MNVDGSYCSSVGKAACGGLVRDCTSKFIKAFLCNVGFCNTIWAELWALRLGINLELALSRVIFKMVALWCIW